MRRLDTLRGGAAGAVTILSPARNALPPWFVAEGSNGGWGCERAAIIAKCECARGLREFKQGEGAARLEK